MAAKQSRVGDPQPQTFTDTPPVKQPLSEESAPLPDQEPGTPPPDAPLPDTPFPGPYGPEPPTPPLSALPPLDVAEQAAEFFLNCFTSSEQQQFLDFCTMRGLTPAAGFLAFAKEKMQRGDMHSLNNNPFTDEAQQAVEDVQQQMHPTPTPTQPQPTTALQSYQLGRKPMKSCEVCQTPFVVDFMGRLLCSKPECWHTYAGIAPQQPTTRGAPVDADTSRRLGNLETMMERITQHLDRLVGA